MTTNPLPLLALVGRPNVGKSTLFNRIVGKRLAIVEDRPGVTRDRQYAEAQHESFAFRVVDTGGFTPTTTELLVKAVREQALKAIEEADCLILVVDARTGLLPADQELAQLLRRGNKPVLIAANKLDAAVREGEVDLAEIHALGLDVFNVSAEHGRGVGELMDAVLTHLPTAPKMTPEEAARSGLSRRKRRQAERVDAQSAQDAAHKAAGEKLSADAAVEGEGDDPDEDDEGDGDAHDAPNLSSASPETRQRRQSSRKTAPCD